MANEVRLRSRLRLHETAQIVNREAAPSEAQANLTDEAKSAILDSGIIEMMLPESLGGEARPYHEWAAAVEEISRADGVSGWILQATGGNVGCHSSFISDAGVQELFANGVPIVAGMSAPRARAERVAGGYNFTGTHQFASGSSIATHFIAGAFVYENGEPVLLENGSPQCIDVFVPRENVRDLGNWDVNGLEATASVDYQIGPLFIPNDLASFVNPWPTRVLRGNRFWSLGVGVLGPVGHAPVALGVAQRALEEIALLAPNRQRQDGPYAAVGDQPYFQHELVLREAELAGARKLYYDLIEQLEDWADTHDVAAPAILGHRTLQIVRYIHDVGVRAVDFAYEWSGSRGLRNGHVIGRAFKNMHAMNQHIVVDRHNYIDASSSIMDALAEGARGFAQP